jgi:hypothetical protein
MTNAEIERGLEALGVDRNNVKVLALLPLVQVAWADGVIQDEERVVIEAAAGRLGVSAFEVFKGWLDHRPTALEFLTGQQILLALTATGGSGLVPDTLPQLVEWCGEVAEAAGGLFGLAFKVEASEKAVIAEIANLLQLGPAIDWAAVGRAFPESP